MGEMADYYLEQDWGDFDGPNNCENKEIVCKFCKERGFHWKQLPNGKWRLFDEYGMHSCKGKTDGK